MTKRRPTHPGKILREDVLPAPRMSAGDAAKAFGVSRRMLHRVLKGQSGVTPEMALRIGKFCDNGPGVWLGMQQDLDLWDAQRSLADEIERIETHQAA